MKLCYSISLFLLEKKTYYTLKKYCQHELKLFFYSVDKNFLFAIVFVS